MRKVVVVSYSEESDDKEAATKIQKGLDQLEDLVGGDYDWVLESVTQSQSGTYVNISLVGKRVRIGFGS